MAGDALWPYVAVSFDPFGTAATALSQTDNRGNVFGTQAGSPQFSASWAATGGISAWFNGSARAQCAHIPALNFGTGDFEINLWVYQASRSGTVPATLLGFGQDTGGQGWRLSIGTTGFPIIQAHSGPSVSASAAIPLNVGTHIAVTRVSGTVTFWINGVATGGGLWTTPNNYGSVLQLSGTIGPNWLFTGFMDRIEVLSGIARHTSAFTPETSAFVPYAGQVSGVIRDAANALCARTVRAYRRDTGALIGNTVSNAGTGAYSLNLPTNHEVSVIALDDAPDTFENDRIIRVVPT